MGYFTKFPKQVLALSFKEIFYWKTRWPELLIRLVAPCLMVLLMLIIQRTYLQQVTSGGDVLYESDFTAEIPSNLVKPKDGEKYVYFIDFERSSYSDTPLGIEIIKTMASINVPPLTVSPQRGSFGSWNCSEDICIVQGVSGSFTEDEYKKMIDSTKLLGGWLLDIYTYSTTSRVTLKVLPKYNIFSGNAFLPTTSGATKPSDEANKYMLSQAIYKTITFMKANITNDIQFTINHKKSASPTILTGRTDIYNQSQYFITVIIPFLLSIPLFLSASFVNAFVDRDRLLRVGMKMYGLYNSAYWFFVYLFQASALVIVCALIVILGYICQLDFFILTTDPLTIFIILWSTSFYYCCLLTAMGTFIRSKVGSNLMLFLIFISNTFFTLTTFDVNFVLAPTAQPLVLPLGIAYAGSGLLFFPTFAYSSAMAHISYGTTYYKSKAGTVAAPGFTDSDFWISAIKAYYAQSRSGYSRDLDIQPPAVSVAVILGQALFFLLLTMYLDNVVPPAFDGIRQSIFYPFSLKYWGFGWGRKIGKDDLAIDFETKSTAFEVMEDIDPDLTREYKETINSFNNDDVAISVIQLSKTFTSIFKKNTNNKNALNGVSFNVKKNQITAILGHSAAGKSTLCKILTGLMSTSSGDALINKVSVAQHFQHVQENIGVCMQEDFIIDDLTAKHHLYFFALLRGMPFSKLKGEAFTKLDRVFLTDSANKVTKTFSGGMKRRLSLATSMIGDPDILFLDEPTTATDIVIKRKVWNMLVDYKKTGKTIILTTHSMEEAENIGDKVVVMALGKMRACGNIHHLKKRWAAGYRLDLFFNQEENIKTIENVKDVIGVKYNPKKIALAKENKNINSLTYRMNMKSTEIYQFLEYLNTRFTAETNATLKDFALSFTSLKDVFLRVTHGGTQDFEESEVVDRKYKNQAIEEESDTEEDGDINDTPVVNKRFFNMLSQVQSEKIKLVMDKNYSFGELLNMNNLEFEIIVKSRH